MPCPGGPRPGTQLLVRRLFVSLRFHDIGEEPLGRTAWQRRETRKRVLTLTGDSYSTPQRRQLLAKNNRGTDDLRRGYARFVWVAY